MSDYHYPNVKVYVKTIDGDPHGTGDIDARVLAVEVDGVKVPVVSVGWEGSIRMPVISLRFHGTLEIIREGEDEQEGDDRV